MGTTASDMSSDATAAGAAVDGAPAAAAVAIAVADTPAAAAVAAGGAAAGAASGGAAAAAAFPSARPDLLIVTDATGSMHGFLVGIREALPQFFHIATMTRAFDRIGIISYYDYSDSEIIRWSGYLDPADPVQAGKLKDFADKLTATGGGDWPEAAKTAASRACEVIRPEVATTLVVWYADAPPHHASNGELANPTGNRAKEHKALGGDKDPAAADWVALMHRMAARGAVVCPIISFTAAPFATGSFFAYAAAATGGHCLTTFNDGESIAGATIKLFLALAGQPANFDHRTQGLVFSAATRGGKSFALGEVPPYIGATGGAAGAAAAAAQGMVGITNDDTGNLGYLPTLGGLPYYLEDNDTGRVPLVKPTTAQAELDVLHAKKVAAAAAASTGATAAPLTAAEKTRMAILEEAITGTIEGTAPVMAPPPVDPRIALDLKPLLAAFKAPGAEADAYRTRVYGAFMELLAPATIHSLTYNALFGAFWRAICERRTDERREALMAQISRTLSALPPNKLAPVKAWLDASYDRTSEVLEEIARDLGEVPAAKTETATADVAGAASVTVTVDAPTADAAVGAAAAAASGAAAATAPRPRFPAYVCDVTEQWKAQDLMEIAHSCSPNVVARVARMLGSLRTIDAAPGHSKAAAAGAAAGAAAATSATDAAAADKDAEKKEEAAGSDVPYLPVALRDYTLFKLLPHLLCPGSLVTLRPAVIFAAVAASSHVAPLEERARAFMRSVRGKWFNEETPENFTAGFVRLMLRVKEDALTPEESARFEQLRSVAGFIHNTQTTLHVNTRSLLSKPVALPDKKTPCTGCGKARSFTLMTPGTRCAKCVSGFEPQMEEPLAGDRSYFCDCFACGARYAVVNVPGLRVRPKCHYCRTGTGPAPVQRCVGCNVYYVKPDATEPCSDFTCPACTAGDAPGVEEHTPTMAVLAKEIHRIRVATDPKTWSGIKLGADAASLDTNLEAVLAAAGLTKAPAPPAAAAAAAATATAAAGAASTEGPIDILTTRSLYKMRDALVPVAAGAASAAAGAASVAVGGAGTAAAAPLFVFKQQVVLNPSDVAAEIAQWVTSGRSELGTCGMCWEDVPKTRLRSLCGRTACKAVACETCVKGWYGTNKPGGLLHAAHLQCPFCKRVPAPQVLAGVNPQLCGLVVRGRAEFDPAFYFTWCTDCYKPCEYMPRACADEIRHGPPEVADFCCVDCQERRAAAAAAAGAAAGPGVRRLRECPGCTAMTIRVSGCAHMTCACGQHFCFDCGQGFEDATATYTHMSTCAGDNTGVVHATWVPRADDDDDEDIANVDLFGYGA